MPVPLLRSIALAFLVVACLAGAVVAGAGAAKAAASLDTRALPRLEGATEPFTPSADLTSYDLPAPAVQTRAEAVLQLLGRDGWQRYVHPNVRTTTGENVVIATLKKGPHSIRVVVAHATRDALATRITYEARRLTHDLPFPAGSRDIAYEPEKPQLIAFSDAPPDDVREAVSRDLQASGWQPQSAARGAPVFTKPGAPPVSLSVTRLADGRTRIGIQPLEGRAARALSGLPAEKEAEPDLKGLLAEARKTIAEAEREAGERQPRARRGPPQPVVGEQPLEAATDTLGAPIPVPKGAENATFDADRGRLEFRSASSIHALATFYRAQMKARGWTEEPSVINSETFVSLNFKKGREAISFSIMARNAGNRVSATGRGLVVASRAATPAPAAEPPRQASPPPSAHSPPATLPEQVPGDRLAASDQRGLIVPAPHASAGSERTPYRQEANAIVAASIADILAFYARELGSRGWSEIAGTRTVAEATAQVRYTLPDGSGLLTLVRKPAQGVTEVRLLVRRDAKARADGVAPKPGRSMIVFSNMEDVAATVKVEGKTIRVAGGAGAQAADGPKADLPPGEHVLSIQIGKQAPRSQPVTLTADQTTGVILGPRGALVVPLY